MTATVAPPRLAALTGSCLLWACSPADALPVYAETTASGTDGDTDSVAQEDSPVVTADEPPPPISGGTMLLAARGPRVVVADPDRDFVFVVDASRMVLAHAIELQAGDQPTRLTEDDNGRVHVINRGSNSVVSLDPRTGEILHRRPVCMEPRGIAFDPHDDALWVACSTSTVVRLDASGGGVTGQWKGPADARDIFIDDAGIHVTTFREADVHTLNRSGQATGIEGPLTLAGVVDGARFARLRPAVAWRTRPVSGGGWLMIHQRASSLALGAGDLAPVLPFPAYYAPAKNNCEGTTLPSVSLRRPDGTLLSTQAIADGSLYVDGALSPSGDRLALVSPSRKDGRSLALVNVADLDDNLDAKCFPPDTLDVYGQLTSVEFAEDDIVWVASREPATVTRIDLSTGEQHAISMHRSSVQDTGHDLFHLDDGSGTTCASCHPEGEDDGLVREFVEFGDRRTQSLRIGLADTAPYHWEGEFQTVAELMAEIHAIRMNARPRPERHYQALADWLFTLPLPQPRRPHDDADAVEGRAVFERLGCAACHSGPALTNNLTQAPATHAPRQVPSLRSVGSHPPYMHDGRAPTLRDAVLDMLTWTPSQSVTPRDIDLVVAYLEST